MKTCILDTHTLVWFLQKDKRLSSKALKLLVNDSDKKIIPFIVLCEIHYLHAKSRFNLTAKQVVDIVNQTKNFEIANQSVDLVPYLMDELEIHDALIVATALLKKEQESYQVIIVSKDHLIHQHSPLEVVWD